jgi:hypothetical protein
MEDDMTYYICLSVLWYAVGVVGLCVDWLYYFEDISRVDFLVILLVGYIGPLLFLCGLIKREIGFDWNKPFITRPGAKP